MKDDGAPHPVELLRDQRGVYGIGVSELFDFEAIAWSCGFSLRAPRAHLPGRRAQSSRPPIDRDVPGPCARHLLGALAGRRIKPPQNRSDASRRSRRPIAEMDEALCVPIWKFGFLNVSN
jgi:hypothetical protein